VIYKSNLPRLREQVHVKMVRIDGVHHNVCIYINRLIRHYALAMIIPNVAAPAVTIPHPA
jgi:hypothetical protein